MSKRRTPKRARDLNELAFQIGQIATGEATDELPPQPSEKAVRRGNARAEALSPKKRRAIAKKAAKARWNKKG